MGIPDDILHARGTFFSCFPPEQRSTAANILLGAVRDGCSDPHQVVAYALAQAARRTWNEAARTLRLLSELDFEALLAGARWALWWEGLPLSERQRIKGARASAAIERWLAEQPPTEKQLRYLHSLGYRGPEPTSRLKASKLIDALVKGGERASR